MRDNKVAVFAFTYKEEGGYSNDAHDPGGATNLGIIQSEYDAYLQSAGRLPRPVKYITHQEADEIYTKHYWNKIDGDELPFGIDLVIYDYAVNSGPYRAVRYAQLVLGVEADGILGPITLAALKSADAKEFILAYDAKRLSFLQGLSIFEYFGRGWTARVKRATNEALKMINEAPKYIESKQSERGIHMWFDVVLGIARHVITGGGAGAVGLTGFDTHNPMTWIGVATFIGGSVFSAIDKAQKSGHISLQNLIVDTLTNVNDKLDEAAKTRQA